jgi:hypothetical protein
MKKTPFIWLGSGRAQKRDVANKGLYLDKSAQAGLPVPEGGILLDEFYQICLQEGLVTLTRDGIRIPDPIWLQEVLFRDVRFPQIKKKVVIWPAVDLSPGQEQFLRRQIQFIDFGDPQQFARQLSQIWSEIYQVDQQQRLDVLITTMVDGQNWGLAVTVHDADGDQILIFADPDQDNYVLPRLGRFQKAAANLDPHNRRLQKLLRGVRRTFGRGNWRINWADDGQVCWLFGVAEVGDDFRSNVKTEVD